MNKIKQYLNRLTSDEGCTSVDARKLRQANHGLADENQKLKTALMRVRSIMEVLEREGAL